MKQHIGYIENGINLDHIPQGNAWYVIKVLNLTKSNNQTGVGLNLPSKKLGYKDLIKIENYVLTPEETSTISLFCVGATLSIIEDFKVISKTTLELAPTINDLIICPNPRCVSHSHISKFTSSINRQQQITLKCHYCEQAFLLNDIHQYKI